MQSRSLLDKCGLIVAGEGFCYHFPVGLFGEEAHKGDDDHTSQHDKGAAIDGGLKQRREQGLCNHVDNHYDAGEEETDPDGYGGGPLPVQSIQERRKERASQSPP